VRCRARLFFHAWTVSHPGYIDAENAPSLLGFPNLWLSCNQFRAGCKLKDLKHKGVSRARNHFRVGFVNPNLVASTMKGPQDDVVARCHSVGTANVNRQL
jgi:hypothetical protein